MAECADGTILLLDTFVMPGAAPDHGVGELWKSHDDLRTVEGPFWASAIDIGGKQVGAACGILNAGGNVGGFIAPVFAQIDQMVAGNRGGVQPQAPGGYQPPAPGGYTPPPSPGAPGGYTFVYGVRASRSITRGRCGTMNWA